PGVLVGGVVDDQVDDDPDSALARLVHELDEVAQGAKARVDAVVVGDVVAPVLGGRGVKGLQPQASDPEAGDVRQALEQSAEVADAVAVTVLIGPDVQLIDDGVSVPEVGHGSTPGQGGWRPPGRGVLRVCLLRSANALKFRVCSICAMV